MKSGLRRLGNKTATPPVHIGNASSLLRGHSFNLGVGQGDRETFMRQYSLSGTVYSIVSLLAEASATPRWRLFRSDPVDARRRYSTGDYGSDQRVEVIQHAAIKLWNNPNPYMTGFEFREAAQLHQELTGETYWVLDLEAGFPTAMWLVRPDRMDPVMGASGELNGWMYTGPNGDQVPLKVTEVISEKRPDPMDPYRGLGPVQAIMPNIQQQRYATEYQRNMFLNGATPGGIISFPNAASDREIDELIERWRESHRGVARAGHIGILENGATWTPAGATNRDMEYANLRLANRDELREAWRVHKTMLGTSDDVNRANAQTAEEVFVAWQVIPRLNRRRDTVNNKLLPLFGTTGQGVEFDYDDPSPENQEAAAKELVDKATALQLLVTSGCDLADAIEVVGLPAMDAAKVVPALPADAQEPMNRQRVAILAKKDAQAKAIEQESEDFPPSAMAWMYHAQWSGPLDVPLGHINPTMNDMEGVDPGKVQKFRQRLQDGKKLNPVILVKTPDGNKLRLIEGHHRYLAYAELGKPVLAYVAVVDAEHGDWDHMHSQQKKNKNKAKNGIDAAALAALLERPFTARAVGTSWNRG